MTNKIRLGIEGFTQITIKPLPIKVWAGFIGEAGAGKTVFCITSLNYHLENGRNAIYASTEMTEDQLIQQARSLGFQWEKFIEEGSLFIIDTENQYWENGNLKRGIGSGKTDLLNYVNFTDAVIAVRNQWELNEESILVIDSVAGLWEDKPAMSRKFFRYIKRKIQNYFSMALITSQLSVGSNKAFGFGIEHLVDSIFRMGHYFEDGKVKGWILCQKMRGVQINRKLLRSEISNKGGFKIKEVINMEGRYMTVYDAFSG
jgi:KaiC/GvpD/RAD55 family RecA-like ATPase